jgi:hypothetical protein
MLTERPDQNNLMTMSNVLFKKEYPAQYTSVVSTRVSNSLLVGAILGQASKTDPELYSSILTFLMM